MSLDALFVAVFLAAFVEAVEAATIVLAMGISRGWTSALQGSVAAIVVLGMLILIFGQVLTHIPLNWIRLVIGGLLAIYGLQWLRKSILRASGFMPVHDEGIIYERYLSMGQTAVSPKHSGVKDWYGWTISFKGVLLEGLEVVVIVLTFGATQHSFSTAVIAALCAIVVVTFIAVGVRKPLSVIPENWMKFIVGTLLTTFGVFWCSEGAGAHWPGNDAALLAVYLFINLLAFFLITLFRMVHAKRSAAGTTQSVGGAV